MIVGDGAGVGAALAAERRAPRATTSCASRPPPRERRRARRGRRRPGGARGRRPRGRRGPRRREGARAPRRARAARATATARRRPVPSCWTSSSSRARCATTSSAPPRAAARPWSPRPAWAAPSRWRATCPPRRRAGRDARRLPQDARPRVAGRAGQGRRPRRRRAARPPPPRPARRAARPPTAWSRSATATAAASRSGSTTEPVDGRDRRPRRSTTTASSCSPAARAASPPRSRSRSPRAHRPTLVLVGRTPLADEDPSSRRDADRRELQAGSSSRRMRAADPQVTPAAVEAGLPARSSASARCARRSRACEAAGARVEHRACDVRDDGRLRAPSSTTSTPRHGRIDGVVHGAGVIEDKLVHDKDPASFERVIETKVHGAARPGRAAAPGGRCASSSSSARCRRASATAARPTTPPPARCSTSSPSALDRALARARGLDQLGPVADDRHGLRRRHAPVRRARRAR